MTTPKPQLAVPAMRDALIAVMRLAQMSPSSVPDADTEQLSGLYGSADAFLSHNLTVYVGHRFGDTVICKTSTAGTQLARLESWTVNEDGEPMLDLACLGADHKATGIRIQIYLADCHRQLSSQHAPELEDDPAELAEAPGM